jgi:hypothetical protein
MERGAGGEGASTCLCRPCQDERERPQAAVPCDTNHAIPSDPVCRVNLNPTSIVRSASNSKLTRRQSDLELQLTDEFTGQPKWPPLSDRPSTR